MPTETRQIPLEQWLRTQFQGDQFGDVAAGGLPMPGTNRAGVPITFRELYGQSPYWTGQGPDFGDPVAFARDYWKTDNAGVLAKLKEMGIPIQTGANFYNPATGMVAQDYTDNPDSWMEQAIMGGLMAGVGGLAFSGAGAGAGSGALEGAGAFGGEALGAAANSAGAFGGSVAPWTAGAGGVATGATNMDLGDWWDWGGNTGGEGAFGSPYADPIEGLIDLTNKGMTGEQAVATLSEINPAWTQTSLEFLANNPSEIISTITKKVGTSAAKDIFSRIANGDASVSDILKNIGIPAAMIAGLFEKNNSPLQGTLTDAAQKAVSSAGAFAGMPAVGMQPSSQRAINLANSSTGAWQPYVDKAAAYTNKAAGGIPSIDLSTYMNPYLDSVLSPAIRDIEEAAAKRRKQMKHLADVSGNDTYIPGSTESTRYGVESGLIDRDTLRAIGDVSANARKGAFDTATGLASTDLNRTGAAGGAFNTLANTVGTQGRQDFTTLGAAGELEAKPQENALTKAADTTKLYTSVIPGTASAATATKNPSILGQAVGAFGAYNAADKAGLFRP